MSKSRDFSVSLLLLAPALVLLGGLLVWPLVELSLRSFTDPAGPLVFYERLISVPSYLQILIRTLMFSAGTALLCLLLGYPVAYALSNSGPFARGLILIAVMLPFWTNLMVRSYGWIIFLSPRGVLNETLLWLGVIRQPFDLIYNVEGVLVFVHVTLLDNRSEFLSPLLITVRQEDDQFLVEASQAVAKANAVAFLSEELHPAAIYLGLSRQNLMRQSFRYVLLGEGETGLMVYTILQHLWKSLQKPGERPRLFLMSD